MVWEPETTVEEAAPPAASPAAGPVATSDEGDVTNPAVATIDPTPADLTPDPGLNPDGSVRTTNLTGYFVRLPDGRNHRDIIVGHAEPFQIAARESEGLRFIGYKPD